MPKVKITETDTEFTIEEFDGSALRRKDWARQWQVFRRKR